MKTKSISKTNCRKRVRQLINNSAESMRKDLERVFLSGAINLGSYEDDYVVPRTILLALLKEQLSKQAPTPFFSKRKQMEKDAKNIYIML
jgi:hypothetical protein